jgi:hypothetical protein
MWHAGPVWGLSTDVHVMRRRYHLVQFACLFCAGYSGLLIVAAQLTGDDPLAAFQVRRLGRWREAATRVMLLWAPHRSVTA